MIEISTIFMCCAYFIVMGVTTYVYQKVKFEIGELTDMVYRLESQINKMKREIAKLNRKVCVTDNDDKDVRSNASDN